MDLGSGDGRIVSMSMSNLGFLVFLFCSGDQ